MMHTLKYENFVAENDCINLVIIPTKKKINLMQNLNI